MLARAFWSSTLVLTFRVSDGLLRGEAHARADHKIRDCLGLRASGKKADLPMREQSTEPDPWGGRMHRALQARLSVGQLVANFCSDGTLKTLQDLPNLVTS